MKKTPGPQLHIERGEGESLVDFIERMGERIFCLTTEEQEAVNKKKAAYARWVNSHKARHQPKVHVRPPKAAQKTKRPVPA